jgi:hypothetical protein
LHGSEVVGANRRRLINFFVHRFNCERVLGMDTCKSLLLICNEHTYLLDGFQIVRKGNAGNFVRRGRQSSERVLEVDEAAHDASAHAVVQRYVCTDVFQFGARCFERIWMGGHAHNARTKYCRYAYADIVGIHRRRYLLRHVALELFLSCGQTVLVAFDDRRTRDEAAGQLYQR